MAFGRLLSPRSAFCGFFRLVGRIGAWTLARAILDGRELSTLGQRIPLIGFK
jgi:hypothetical protein